MSCLFIGNFDFEYRLADSRTRQLTASLERINAELASVWTAVSDEGDDIRKIYWTMGETDLCSGQHVLPGIETLYAIGTVDDGPPVRGSQTAGRGMLPQMKAAA